TWSAAGDESRRQAAVALRQMKVIAHEVILRAEKCCRRLGDHFDGHAGVLPWHMYLSWSAEIRRDADNQLRGSRSSSSQELGSGLCGGRLYFVEADVQECG